MDEMKTWPEYVRSVVGSLKQEQISELSGISQTTVSNWTRGAPGVPKAETVIAFARAFGEEPTEALLAAGYLSEAEALAKARTPLADYSTRELFAELRRRTPD